MTRTSGITTTSLPLLLLLFFLHYLFFAGFYHRVDCCPASCQCTAVSGGGERVVCPPGQTSLPPGLDPGTKTLVFTGRPLPQGGSNIPVLRQSDFTSLSALEELTMPFANLTDIEDDAFGALVNLKRLCLHNNKLKRLTPRTFSGLGKLAYLDLTNNDGCVIQGDVFSQLTSLETLYLGGLGLTEVKAEWFKALSLLESLDLHGNGFESLGSDFLQGLTNMKLLDLTGNDLQSLNSSLRPTFSSIDAVYLTDNPWHCNCQLRWFKQIPRPRHSSADAVVCFTPQPLAFMEIVNVPDNQMVCRPPRILNCGGPYDVNAGSDVIAECRVEGDPFPVLDWKRPDGTVVDTTNPGRLSDQLQRLVNSTAVTAADFAIHHGQWSVTASSSQGSVTGHFSVNVVTTPATTTTTTAAPTTTTTVSTTTRGSSKTTPTPMTTKDQKRDTGTLQARGAWFYVAMAAFGISALALTSLILVAAFKLRKNQRQVGLDRRDSGLSLGSAEDTDVTVLARTSAGLRARVT